MKTLRISCEATRENRPSFDNQIVEQHFKIEFRFEVHNGIAGTRYFGGISRALVITMDAKNYDNDDLLRAMLLQRKRIDIEFHSTEEDEGPFEAIEYVGDAETFLKWLRLDVEQQFNQTGKTLLSLPK